MQYCSMVLVAYLHIVYNRLIYNEDYFANVLSKQGYKKRAKFHYFQPCFRGHLCFFHIILPLIFCRGTEMVTTEIVLIYRREATGSH